MEHFPRVEKGMGDNTRLAKGGSRSLYLLDTAQATLVAGLLEVGDFQFPLTDSRHALSFLSSFPVASNSFFRVEIE